MARVDDSNLPAGANEDLAVIRAPIDGTIIKVAGAVGEMGVPRSPTAERWPICTGCMSPPT